MGEMSMIHKIDWTVIDPQIGVKTDLAIAKEHGISHTIVARRRKFLGIQKAPIIHKCRVKWEIYDHFLGKHSDRNLAAQIGCDRNTVRVRRKRLGIPSLIEPPQRARGSQPEEIPKIDWAKIDPLIGEKTDLALSREFGVSHVTIANRRKQLGRGKGHRDSAYYNIKWAAWDDLLGKEPDTEIAKMIGCSKKVVELRRIELGIGAAEPEKMDNKQKAIKNRQKKARQAR